jgi:hypothetical protein
VHVTNPSRVRLPGAIIDTPWLTAATLARPDYLTLLRQSDIVLAPHRATHWSISTLEAIAAGCIPLMNVESFFPEMMERIFSGLPASTRTHVLNRWFYFRSAFGKRFQDILDNLSEEREVARLVAARARDVYDWAAWATPWLEMFHEAEREIPPMADRNPSLLRIRSLVERDGAASKEEILRELGWAPKQRAVAWTSMRKNLKQAFFEDARQAEVLFHHVVPGQGPVEPAQKTR